METKQLSIAQVARMENIPFFTFRRIGKSPEEGSMPTGYNGMTNEQIASIKDRPEHNALCLLLKRTTNIFVLDVDDYKGIPDKMKPILAKVPYTLSMNKHLPHYWFTSDIPPYSMEVNVFNDFIGDLIHYHKSIFESKLGTMSGYEDGFPFISFETLKPFLNCPEMKFNKKKKQYKMEENEPEISLTDLVKEVGSLLNIISSDRVETRDSWMRMGWCLRNIFKRSKKNGLDLWIAKSSEWPDWKDDSECRAEWEKMDPHRDMTIGTLKMWAKEDSPEEYEKLYPKKKRLAKEIIEDEEINIDITNISNDHDLEYFFDVSKSLVGNIIPSSDASSIINRINKVAVYIRDVSGSFFITKNLDIENKEELNFGTKNGSLFGRHDFFIMKHKDSKTKKILLNNFIAKYIHFIPTYSKVGFYPMHKCPPSIYNLFNGWCGKKVPWVKEHIDIFLNHIYKGFANGNQESFDFLLNWFAGCVQGKKNEVMVILYNPHQRRGGKSVFLEGFAYNCIGQQYSLCCKSTNEITDRFNVHLINKTFVILDEVFFAGDKKTANQMKSLISQHHHSIEIKCGSKFETPDFINYIATTNIEDCISLETSDRRHAFFEVKEWDSDYLTKLYEAFQDKSLCDEFISFLLDHDVSKFYAPNCIPETNMREDLLDNAKPPIESFISEHMTINKKHEKVYDFVDKSIADVFIDFKIWCDVNNISYKYITRKCFTRRVNLICHLKSTNTADKGYIFEIKKNENKN